MLIDTDVLIWCLRGHPKAVKSINELENRQISHITRMELVIGCRDKREILLLKRFLADGDFKVIPLSPEIGHRADIYLEEKHLSHGVGLADAMIAASASLTGQSLFTGNFKHFRCFPNLHLKRFTP